MHILIFSRNAESRSLIALALKSRLDVDVTTGGDLQSAMEALLDDRSIDLIIYDVASQTDHLLKFILSADAKIPLALLVESGETFTYPDLNVIGSFCLSELPD